MTGVQSHQDRLRRSLFLEPAESVIPTESSGKLNGFGGSGSGLAGSPEPDHSFIERPDLWDTWPRSKQEFWDHLVERLPKHKTPRVTLNVSQIARDYECSRTWVQQCLDFFVRCNLLSRLDECDRGPREYRVHWDLREKEVPDLPFLFSWGGATSFKISSKRRNSISDEDPTRSLTDSEKHQTMKRLRLQLTGKVQEATITAFGSFLWSTDPSLWLVRKCYEEIFVVNLSLNERSEGGVQPYLFGLARKWLNDVLTRLKRQYRSEIEERRRKQKRREESTSVPSSCIEKLKSNGVIDDGRTTNVA